MPYMILAGTYHIVGKRPDGDTVAFRPTNPDHWLKKSWLETTRNRVPATNAASDVSLRLEAIDALETHYRAKDWLPEYRQPTKFALQARDTMLASLGISPAAIVWDGDKVVSAPDGTPGYIATNGIDPYGRVIAFAFSGTPPTSDGNDGFELQSEHVQSSVNFGLARQGLVYPTFYTGLYPSLRETMAAACVAARRDGQGLWPMDASLKGVAIPNSKDLSPITDQALVMPKLFRRLVMHLSQNGTVKSFRGFLYDNEDATIHIPKVELATLRRYVRVDERTMTVALRFPPEQFVFLPD